MQEHKRAQYQHRLPPSMYLLCTSSTISDFRGPSELRRPTAMSSAIRRGSAMDPAKGLQMGGQIA